MSQPYIIMIAWERDSTSGQRVPRARKITVIDGQPYYQSTGVNSQEPGKWFPFIMLKGDVRDQPHNIEILYQYNLNQLAHTLTTPGYGPLYLMKYDIYSVSSKFEKKLHIDLYDGRIPTKATLITANQLGIDTGETFSKEILETYLNDEEIEQAKTVIQLADRPEFQTDSSYLINNWLIQHGAIAASLSLNGNDWNNEERIRREIAAAKLLANDHPSVSSNTENLRYGIRQSFFKSHATRINDDYPVHKPCKQHYS